MFCLDDSLVRTELERHSNGSPQPTPTQKTSYPDLSRPPRRWIDRGNTPTVQSRPGCVQRLPTSAVPRTTEGISMCSGLDFETTETIRSETSVCDSEGHTRRPVNIGRDYLKPSLTHRSPDPGFPVELPTGDVPETGMVVSSGTG